MLKNYKIDNISLKNSLEWQDKILKWYQINKRQLPWRKKKYQNFYCVWLSEIMLQQTGVKTAIPYFYKFIRKWPTLNSFSKASLDEIMFNWQGLGYYQRAKNMFKAIDIIKQNYPIKSYEELMKIPGIGTYTAASISAILYDNTKAVVDGNIKRILSRVMRLNPANKTFEKKLNTVAQNLTPKKNNGSYCQALMDLGSLICRPKNPLCKKCPVNSQCHYYIYPEKRIKKMFKNNKKSKFGVAFYLSYKNLVYLEKSDSNFLYGLMKFPCTEFLEINKNDSQKSEKKLEKELISNFLKTIKLKFNKYETYYVKHAFTNFYLKLLVVKIKLKSKNNIRLNGFWMEKKQISCYPFSRLMDKVKIGFDQHE